MSNSGTTATLRIAGGAALLALAVACGLAYYLFVAHQQQYLIQRNFRILAAAGTQFDSITQAEATVFQKLSEDCRCPGTEADAEIAGSPRQRWRARLSSQWKARYDGEQPRIVPFTSAEARATVSGSGSAHRLVITVTDKGAPAGRPDSYEVNLGMARYAPLVTRGKTGPTAFDTLLLVTSTGDVVLGDGQHLGELTAGGLSALTFAAGKDGKAPRFADVANTSGLYDAVVSGEAHKLFIAPCCRQALATGGSLFVVGFAETSAFERDSRAISSTIVKTTVLTLLLAAVAWPFLRLVFIGERQRLRRVDLFHVTLSGIAALALLTIIGLDAIAYARLNRDRDAQLTSLAESIERDIQDELAAASRQLTCTSRWLRTQSIGTTPVGDQTRQALACTTPAGGIEIPYPDFESVALIDAAGRQLAKASPKTWTTSRVTVAERDYFRSAMAGTNLPFKQGDCPAGCAVSSLLSMTTGKPQTVLARRETMTLEAMPGQGPGGEITVASIAIPMHSAIDPLIPGGFQFAVISEDGRVQFHSNQQRNGIENFFDEIDDSRRIRAKVHGHGVEPLDIMYWGSAYRAFLKPIGGTPWSVVTMYSMDEGWALNREWLIVAVLFLAFYLLLWLVVAAVTVVPGYAWAWPNPMKEQKYVWIAYGQLLLVSAAALVAWWGDRSLVIQAGMLMPIIGWVVPSALLRSSRWEQAPTPGGRPSAYPLAAALTLFTCGVLPAGLLFAASYQLHMQGYVRNNALEHIRQLLVRPEMAPQAPVDDAGNPIAVATLPHVVGNYADSVYEMRLSPILATTFLDGPNEDPMIASFEDYLPYYSEASVRWREMFHKRAGDLSWDSWPVEDRQMALGVSGTMVVTSREPAMFHDTRPAPNQLVSGVGWSAAGVVLGLALCGAAWTLASILRRHFFLAGVEVPRWARLKLALDAGDNVFVWCDDITAQQEPAPQLPSIDLGAVARAEQPEREWRRTMLRLNRTDDAGLSVVVRNLDEDLDEAEVMERKIGFLDTLIKDDSFRSVIVLSRRSPFELAETLGTGALRSQWRGLLQAFVLMDWRPAPARMATAASAAEGAAPTASISPAIEFLQSEAACGDRFVGQVCHALMKSLGTEPAMTREQVFDELADRTTHYYRRIWNACSDEDKVILGHVAQDGLVPWSGRRAVRRLLAKGLLCKDPDLRVMTATFRAFVLGKPRLAEAQRVEADEAPSTWDRLQMPLAFVLVSAGVFLFITQKELYNALLGTTTAAAVSIPALVKAVSTLASAKQGDGKKDA